MVWKNAASADTNEFVFHDFFGRDYTEDQFRKGLSNSTILVSKFSMKSVDYVLDPADPTLATATVIATIEATVNGVFNSGDYTVTHQIKQGWQTYDSTVEVYNP